MFCLMEIEVDESYHPKFDISAKSPYVSNIREGLCTEFYGVIAKIGPVFQIHSFDCPLI